MVLVNCDGNDCRNGGVMIVAGISLIQLPYFLVKDLVHT